MKRREGRTGWRGGIASVPRSPVFAVGVGTLLVMASEGVVGPILPLYARELGATVGIVGLVVGSAGLARLVFNLPAGSVSDSIGRRPLLVVGPLLTAGAAVLAGLAGNVWQLLAYRFVAGMGNGLFMTGSIILLGDIEEDRKRIRAIGVYRATVMVGITLGPVAGGLVAEAAGLRAPFFLVAGLAGTAALWSYGMVQEAAHGGRSHPGKAGPTLHRRLRLVMRNRNLLLVSLMTFNMFFILVGTRQSLIPLLVRDRVDAGVGTVGLLLGVISLANLASIGPAAYLAGRIGRKPVIVASGLISGLSLMLFVAGAGLAGFILAGVIMGVGTGLASPSTATYATEVASPEARGSAMGLYQMLGDGGFVVGPVTLGWLAQTSGFGWALSFNAALVLVASALFLLHAVEPREVVRRRRDRAYVTEGDLPALEDRDEGTS